MEMKESTHWATEQSTAGASGTGQHEIENRAPNSSSQYERSYFLYRTYTLLVGF